VSKGDVTQIVFFGECVEPYLEDGQKFTSEDVLEILDDDAAYNGRESIDRVLNYVSESKSYINCLDDVEDGCDVFRYESRGYSVLVDDADDLFESVYSRIEESNGLHVINANEMFSSYVRGKTGSSAESKIMKQVGEVISAFEERYDVEKRNHVYRVD